MTDNNNGNGLTPTEKWKKLETLFMQSDGNLNEFAKVNELAYSTLYKHSAKNNWIKKREKMKLDNLLAGKVDFDIKCSETLMKGLKTINEAIEFGIDAKSTPPLMRCIRDIQEGMYRLMDIPLPKQRIENDTADKTPLDDMRDVVLDQIQNLDPNDLVKQYLPMNDDDNDNTGERNGNGNGNGNGN